MACMLLMAALGMGSILHKHIVTDPSAVCNDGSHATYYLSNSSASAQCWVIYLQGGGLCTSAEKCAERAAESPGLVSSLHYPATHDGLTLLSSDASLTSALASCAHVFLPYCSSDLWIGAGGASSSGMTFAGEFIFRGAITDLLASHGLNLATQLTLAGSSAGGVGAMNHMGWLSSQLAFSSVRSASQLRLVVDSCLFVDFPRGLWQQAVSGGEGAAFNETTGALWGVGSSRACGLDGGACLDAKTMLLDGSVPMDISTLLVSSLYDAYMFATLVSQQRVQELSVNLAEQYSGHMQAVLAKLMISRPTLSVFATPCLQHIYLPGVLAEVTHVDLTASEYGLVVRFNLNANASRYTLAGESNESLSSALATWSSPTTGPAPALSLLPRCNGFVCDPTCPTSYFFPKMAPGWLTDSLRTIGWVWVIICTTFGALATLAWLHHRWISRLLHRARTEAARPGKDEKESEGLSIPSLDPVAQAGLSFLKLAYTAPNGARLIKNISAYINPCEVTTGMRRSPSCICTAHLVQHMLISIPLCAYAQLSALMGPSGSGKTTLLNLLANRADSSGTVQGDLFLNGRRTSSSNMQSKVGYMLQLAEVFCPELTVRENLAYAAMLRLPTDMSTSDKMLRVDQVIYELNMTCKAHVVVGGATGGGISGGQKRKLSLAMEMLSLPSILFLDEPTSGLDTTSSMELIRSIKAYCLSGRSAVLTIHQPRAEIFASFDKLLLLCKGEMVFFGGPLTGVEFLSDCASVFDPENAYPLNINPADYALDVLVRKADADESGPSVGISKFIVKAYAEAGGDTQIQAGIRRAHVQAMLQLSKSSGSLVASFLNKSFSMKNSFSTKSSLSNESDSGDADSVREMSKKENAHLSLRAVARGGCTAALLWLRTTVSAVATRESRELSRMSYPIYHNFNIMCFLNGAVMGSLYLGSSQQTYMLMAGLYMINTIVTNMMIATLVPFWCDSLAGMYKYEAAAGVATPLQFLVQTLVHSTVLVVMGCSVAFLTIYAPLYDLFNVSLHDIIHDHLMQKMGYSLLIEYSTMLTLMCSDICVCFVGHSLGLDGNNIQVLVALWANFFALFAGFFISVKDVPIFWAWVTHLSPQRYGFDSQARMGLQGFSSPAACSEGADSYAPLTQHMECIVASSGNVLLKTFGYEDVPVDHHMLILLLMFLGYCSLSLIVLTAHDRKWWVALVAWHTKRKSAKKIDSKTRIYGEKALKHTSAETAESFNKSGVSVRSTEPADAFNGRFFSFQNLSKAVVALQAEHTVFVPPAESKTTASFKKPPSVLATADYNIQSTPLQIEAQVLPEPEKAVKICTLSERRAEASRLESEQEVEIFRAVTRSRTKRAGGGAASESALCV